MKNLAFLFSFLLFCVISLTSTAQTSTFTGANSTSWQDPGNWDNGLPSGTAIIPAGLTVQCEQFSEVFVTVVENQGTLLNYGSILIYDDFQNFGTTFNHFELMSPVQFINLGTLYNEQSFSSGFTSENYGTFYNNGSTIHNNSFYNEGTIYNCTGTWFGTLPAPNALEELDCPILDVCDGIDNDQDGTTDEDCGCTDGTACNYNVGAIFEDGSCEYNCPGCTISVACNYAPNATIDDGTCEFSTCQGCTSLMACNYDILASIDDGSCDYESCAGCTYPQSPAYDPLATMDDGSCIGFDLGCEGDLNYDSIVNTLDLLAFLGFFGNACID